MVQGFELGAPDLFLLWWVWARDYMEPKTANKLTSPVYTQALIDAREGK